MSLRSASKIEIDAWERWLWQSHGLRTLPGGLPYLCSVDHPMLLVPWRIFRNFGVRVERRSLQPLMTFQVDGDVQTVAEFWSDLRDGRMPFTLQSQVDMLSRRLTEDAGKGLVWWGVEYPPPRTVVTSILHWFPQSFPIPTKVRSELVDGRPVGVLTTSLQLI